MRPPKDLPPANKGNAGKLARAAATAARTVAWHNAGGSGLLPRFSM